MKLSDWASVAEIVSGVAVVTTLVFLVLGIRENTEVTRSAAYEDLIEDLNRFGLAIAQDEALTELWRIYREGGTEELSEEENFRLTMLLRTMWRTYETAYYSHEYDTLGSSEWQRFQRQMCIQRAISSESQWDSIRSFLTEEFSEHIIVSC